MFVNRPLAVRSEGYTSHTRSAIAGNMLKFFTADREIGGVKGDKMMGDE